MDPEARRLACVEFRATLSRDTGTNLTAATCEALLGSKLKLDGSVEEVSLQSNPGLFYASLVGGAIADQTLALVLPNHLKVAWFCYREAAEVHKHLAGIAGLTGCYFNGQGVPEDPAQAVFWLQKAVDLGDAVAKAALGAFLVNGDAINGVAKDAARGFTLGREAADQGYSPALYHVADCYLKGEGVEKDAVRGVTFLRQIITQGNAATSLAQFALAMCYVEGEGVEADTVQAALWCQRAAEGGGEGAAGGIELLPLIRRCSLCGTTPALQVCTRCRKARYCGAGCQRAHWTRETDPHKGHCRRAADGGASTSTGA